MKFIFKLLLICSLSTTSTFASLAFSKYYILMEGSKRTDNFLVFNNSDKDKNYSVEIVDYIQKEDGTYDKELTKKPANAASSYLINSPRRLSIKAGQHQTVRIQRRTLADAEDGEYVSHILISEIPEDNRSIEPPKEDIEKEELEKELSISIVPIFSSSFPIVVRKGAENTQQVNIENAEIKSKTDDSLILEIELSRTGNISSRGNLIVKARNEVITQADGINIFTNLDKRILTIQVSNKKFLDRLKLGAIGEISISYIDDSSKEVTSSFVIYT